MLTNKRQQAEGEPGERLWARVPAVNTGRVMRFGSEKPIIDAIVNSPSTTVAVRNADVSSATRMLGTRTRNSVVPQPAPSEREASTSVRRSIARSPASSDAVRERHGQHGVERDEHEAAVEEPRHGVLVGTDDADDEGDRRHHVGQHGERLDERRGPGGTRRCTHIAVGSMRAEREHDRADGERQCEATARRRTAGCVNAWTEAVPASTDRTGCWPPSSTTGTRWNEKRAMAKNGKRKNSASEQEEHGDSDRHGEAARTLHGRRRNVALDGCDGRSVVAAASLIAATVRPAGAAPGRRRSSPA